MQAKAVWQNKMKFIGESDNHSVDLDAKAPFGDNSGFTPKELVAIAVAGCTGMDVVALMKKYKQTLESFEISVDAPAVEKTQPPIFKEINLTFIFKGSVDKDKVIEAVTLSQTRFCAVSAMISPTVPINYQIVLNGEAIGNGHADFKKQIESHK